MKLRYALIGTAAHSIEWWPIDWFIHEQAVDQIFNALCEAYDHVNVYEAQQDFESAIYDLTRDRGESLLDFINKAIAAFAKSDKHGEPLSDLKKGMLVLKKGKIERAEEQHIMSMTAGRRELSQLIPCIRQLAARPGYDSKASSYYQIHSDGEEEEWSDWDPRWESYYDDDGEEEEEEEEWATSDEDSDQGNWVLLEAEELAQFQNVSENIPEAALTKELDVYYLGRQEKKRTFKFNFSGKTKLG